jgi:hypothetical protein
VNGKLPFGNFLKNPKLPLCAGKAAAVGGWRLAVGGWRLAVGARAGAGRLDGQPTGAPV